MKRVLVVVAMLAGCGGSGLVFVAVESLPFIINFCHVGRISVDQDTGRVFFLDETEEPPNVITAADCDPLQWTVLSPGVGRSLARTSAMAWDTIRRRLILYEQLTGDILGLQGAGGGPVLLANVVGAGVDWFDVTRIAFDPTGNRVLLIDVARDMVLAFDLVSGQSSIVSPSGAGSPFVLPAGMVVDPARNRLLVCDIVLDKVVAIDLATGARTDFAVPGLSNPSLIDIDVAGDRMWVAGRFDGLFEIDLATGAQESIAGGAGSEDMDYDACGNRLLFSAAISVRAFDLATRTSSLFAR